MKRLVLILSLLAVVLVLLVLLFKGNEKPGMKNVRSDLSVDAATLFADFYADEAAANEKYLNKVVTVKGTVSGVGNSGSSGTRLKLAGNGGGQDGVQCTLDPLSEHQRKEFHLGEMVTLKCIVMDYHRDVVLKNCIER